MEVAVVARARADRELPGRLARSSRAALRPHLRAVYGFARLVDILGDEVEGDRLAALDELERELERLPTSASRPGPCMRALAADDPRVRRFRASRSCD